MSLDPSAQHNSLAPQVARKFDKICDQFEADWKAGRRPRIDVLVYEFAEPDRSVLLRDLLAIDLEYRRTNGETPKVDRYLQRFPEHAAVIRQVFADFDSGNSHGLETAVTRAENAEVSETRGVGTGFELPKATVSANKLGRFQLIEVVGQGAFGTVHRARDPQLERDVALKVPRSGVLVDREDVDRFLREARAAAQLRHPNIVAVYEAGKVDHTYYIASAFVRGTTLREAIKTDRRFTHDEAARLISQLAAALHYAHTQGVIHRDVKPGNIMLDEHGEPHIMDFGLARRTDGDALRTVEGTRMGTPAYMSPEQAQGQSHQADARTDIWSLGVILYELLTGRRPFEGNETEVLLAIRVKDPDPPRKLDKSIPRDLETICLKCLAKDRKDRYATAHTLVTELERWQRGEPISARPAGPGERTWRWAKRNPVVAGLTSAVILLLIAVAVILSISNYHLGQSRNEITKALGEAKDKTTLAENYSHQLQQTLVELRDKEAAREKAEQDKLKAAIKTEVEMKRRKEVEGEVGKVQKERDEAKDLADKESKARQEDKETAKKDRADAMKTSSMGVYIDQISKVLEQWKLGNKNQMLKLLNECSPENRSWDWEFLDRIARLQANQLASWTERIGPNSRKIAYVHRVAFSPNNDVLVVAGRTDSTPKPNEGFLEIWATSTGQRKQRLLAMQNPVDSLAFSTDGNQLVSHVERAGFFNKFHVWDMRDYKTPFVFESDGGGGVLVETRALGKPVAVTTGKIGIDLWDALSGAKLFSLGSANDKLPRILAAAIDPTGKILAVSGSHGQEGMIIQFWNLDSRERLFKLTESAKCFAFSLDGRFFVVAPYDGGRPIPSNVVKLFDTNTGNEIRAFEGLGRRITSLTFSPDGRRLVASAAGGKGGGDCIIRMWDISTGFEIPTLFVGANGAYGTCVSFSSDGKRLVAGDSLGWLRMWESETSTTVRDGNRQ